MTPPESKGRVFMGLNKFNNKSAAMLIALAAFFILPGAFCAASASEKEAAKQAAPGKKPVTVTSDTMEAVTGENRVVFKGNVKAFEDFALCSDQLEILYGKDRDVSRIEANGNVRIIKNDKSSTSERVVYDRKERTLVLTGNAQVTQCADTIKGDRITLYLDRNDAVVESDGGGRVRAVIMPEKGCAETGAGKGEEQGEEALCEGSR